jgi:O-antigen ligase
MTQNKDNSSSVEKQTKPAKPTKKHNPKKSVSGIASLSFLIALFDKICVAFCNALVNGFWGRICSSHSSLKHSFQNGFLKEFIFKDKKAKKISRKIRKFFSNHIENCFISSIGRKIIRFFATAPLNYYGNFGFFFGIYTVVAYIIRAIIPDIESFSSDYIIIGSILTLASFPLLFSKISISSAVLKSSIFKALIVNCFGISEKTLAKSAEVPIGKGNIMLFWGLVAGILSFFIHPLKIILAIFLFATLLFVASMPEIGVVLTVFMIPFFTFFKSPSIALCIAVLSTTFFYVIKLIRGKRIFKLELIDGFVLLFGITIFFASIFSAGGKSSRDAALVSCAMLVGYFLVVNLLRTEKWLKRCVAALVSSATMVAVIAVFEYFFGEENSMWLDTTLFSDIRVRVVSLFDNPNVLSTFLVLIFPFTLVYMLLAKGRNEKFISFLVSLIFVCATVFTWSRGAWIAITACALIFFTIHTRKTLRIFGVLIFALPVAPMLLPDNVINRILSIANLSDSSISYRIYTWIGSIRAIKDHWIGGIGYGSEPFKKIYPYYAYAGIEAAEHSHSLYLQVLLCLGIGGLLTLMVLVFLYFQKCSEYIKAPENNASRYYTAAALSSIIGALVMGIFDYIWFNNRVFFVFWLVMAIGCAFVRAGNNEAERKSSILDYHQAQNKTNLTEKEWYYE